MTINITATVESVAQAEKLLEIGIDSLYLGEESFGLRLPHNFTWEEIASITEMAHAAGKTVTIAVNALMHPEKMRHIKPYLDFLVSIKADLITVGDAGVIHILQRDHYPLAWRYDASTMVVSSRQINFWAQQGAQSAVLAREIPKAEMAALAPQLQVPAEVLVYGATIIHQSLRPLLQNYYNFIKSDEAVTKERGLFLSEPKDETTHYSVYEDSHGTHIFATDDVDMMLVLDELDEMKMQEWKLEGIYTPGQDFVEIAKCFVQAKKGLVSGTMDKLQLHQLDEAVRRHHPQNRTLGRGFYDMDPDMIK